jgi:hypothetical protein
MLSGTHQGWPACQRSEGHRAAAKRTNSVSPDPLLERGLQTAETSGPENFLHADFRGVLTFTSTERALYTQVPVRKSSIDLARVVKKACKGRSLFRENSAGKLGL